MRHRAGLHRCRSPPHRCWTELSTIPVRGGLRGITLFHEIDRPDPVILFVLRVSNASGYPVDITEVEGHTLIDGREPPFSPRLQESLHLPADATSDWNVTVRQPITPDRG